MSRNFAGVCGELLISPESAIRHTQGPFALCYYSGPSSGPEDLSCTMTLLAPGALRGPLNRGSSSLSLPC